MISSVWICCSSFISLSEHRNEKPCAICIPPSVRGVLFSFLAFIYLFIKTRFLFSHFHPYHWCCCSFYYFIIPFPKETECVATSLPTWREWVSSPAKNLFFPFVFFLFFLLRYFIAKMPFVCCMISIRFHVFDVWSFVCCVLWSSLIRALLLPLTTHCKHEVAAVRFVICCTSFSSWTKFEIAMHWGILLNAWKLWAVSREASAAYVRC